MSYKLDTHLFQKKKNNFDLFFYIISNQFIYLNCHFGQKNDLNYYKLPCFPYWDDDS